MSSFEKKIISVERKIAEEQNTPISYVFKDEEIKRFIASLKSRNLKILTKILGDNHLAKRLIKEIK